MTEYDTQPATELEDRLHRLESALAALQDTQLMEERLVERVAAKVTTPSRTAGWRAGAAALFCNGADIVPLQPPKAVNAGRLFYGLWDEFRTFWRMLFDHRYRMSFTGVVGPIAIIVCYLLSWLVVGSIPLVGWMLDRLFAVVLAVLLYKILSREVARYRSMFAYARATLAPPE